MKVLLLALLASISCASVAGAACDPSAILATPYYTDADSIVMWDPYNIYITLKEGFDFHAGRIFGSCRNSPVGAHFMDVRGSDIYRIQGAPGGVAIPLHVELQIDAKMGNLGGSDCGVCNSHISEVYASMYDSQGDADSVSVCLCWHEAHTIALDLSVMPDEEFSIRYVVGAWAGLAGAEIDNVQALVRFSGVPPSAQLVSCHGVNDAAVPTLPATWGRLKATYR